MQSSMKYLNRWHARHTIVGQCSLYKLSSVVYADNYHVISRYYMSKQSNPTQEENVSETHMLIVLSCRKWKDILFVRISFKHWIMNIMTFYYNLAVTFVQIRITFSRWATNIPSLVTINREVMTSRHLEEKHFVNIKISSLALTFDL